MLVVSYQDRLGAGPIRYVQNFPHWDSDIVYLACSIFSCTHPSEGISEWKEIKCGTEETRKTVEENLNGVVWKYNI